MYKSLSIVIPVYNGAQSIGPLVERLIKVLADRRLQIVLVNDCSPDQSDTVCREIQKKYPALVTYLFLSRNFGEHNAVMAGLNESRGDYTVIMDDDFQNPPEEVLRLVDKAEAEDLDIVYSCYRKKEHNWFRNLGSRFTNQVSSYMLDKPRELYLSSFKCLSRFAVERIIEYRGPFPYIDGLALRATRRIGVQEVQHHPREVGGSGYTFRKLVRLWLNMFINFSVMPLRVSSLLGLLLGGLGFLFSLYVLFERLFLNTKIPLGWTTTMIAILIFSGIQLLILGLLGEYLGRLFLSNNQSPQFIVRERVSAGGGSDGSG